MQQRSLILALVVALVCVALGGATTTTAVSAMNFFSKSSHSVRSAPFGKPSYFAVNEKAAPIVVADDGAASCPNACSNAGSCVSNQCQCDQGFLGIDCSIKSMMLAPACVSSPSVTATFCVTYAYVKGVIFGRAQVTPSAGWGGFMFGTKFGMDNGTGLVFSFSNNAPVVQDIQSLKFATPTILSVSSVLPSSVVGFLNTSTDTFDIQFQRAANTGIPGLYVLPTVAGVNTSVSLAVGIKYFSPHVAAQCTLTDLVALGEGQNVMSDLCPSPP